MGVVLEPACNGYSNTHMYSNAHNNNGKINQLLVYNNKGNDSLKCQDCEVHTYDVVIYFSPISCMIIYASC